MTAGRRPLTTSVLVLLHHRRLLEALEGLWRPAALLVRLPQLLPQLPPVGRLWVAIARRSLPERSW